MSQCHILVVDDEPQNLEAIQRTLRGESELTLFLAESAAAAREILVEKNIHALITDHRMPGENGLELLEFTRAEYPNILRILLTAYVDIPGIEKVLRNRDLYGYILKPWSPEHLIATIQQARQFLKLRADNDHLNHDLRYKTDLLMKKNAELKRFNELKNHFMVVASHELRTPATIITGALELLSDQSDRMDPAQKKIVHNALNGALRLNEIIETFFETAQWNAQESTMHVTTVDLKAMIILVLDRFKPHRADRDVEFRMNLDPAIFVLGDQRKLFLVIENLVSNALKYTPNGGMVSIQSVVEKESIIIKFIDTGIGIPEEELENIFETFYQLENLKHHHTSKTAFMGGGTGLGLSLCRSIVEGHQGKIWVESEGVGKGSIFYLQLPRYIREDQNSIGSKEKRRSSD